MLELLEMESGQYSLLCRFKNCDDNFIWIFTGVYGPVHYSERESFWSELGDIKGLWSNPWCVGGDFYVVRLSNERRNCLNLSSTMRRFSEVIDEGFASHRGLLHLVWSLLSLRRLGESLLRPISMSVA